MSLNDDNQESLRNQISQHEDNLKFLYSQSNCLADSILDLQASLGRYRSPNAITSGNENDNVHTKEETMEQILKIENSAASIFCSLKANARTLNLAFTKDVVGVVATLAKVESDDLSRILYEYLGLETMLAIVCKTNEGVNTLEKYDTEGKININDGLHGLASTIGKRINGRFTVICLEYLRPFTLNIAKDPQRKLAILKPTLSTEIAHLGFLIMP